MKYKLKKLYLFTIKRAFLFYPANKMSSKWAIYIDDDKYKECYFTNKHETLGHWNLRPTYKKVAKELTKLLQTNRTDLILDNLRVIK